MIQGGGTVIVEASKRATIKGREKKIRLPKDSSRFLSYKSVQNWLIKPNGERRYKPSTERANLQCLELWCALLNKNPDELIPSNLEEAEAIQRKILARLLEPSLRLKESRILQHTTKYHSFCRFNDFKFPYGGDQIKSVLREVALRVSAEL